ncbi:endopeptidase [Clostridium sp. HV4-5-A1G]|nr:endopeptidase [Clostridium sp. HV4-5-A1G]
MGHYDSEYEKYYNSLKGKLNYSPYRSRLYDRGNSRTKRTNYLTKRIIRDLAGVLILFVFITTCKLLSNSQSKNVYNYSKKIVNENYDYSKLKAQLKNINVNYIGDRVKDVVEQLRIDEKD